MPSWSKNEATQTATRAFIATVATARRALRSPVIAATPSAPEPKHLDFQGLRTSSSKDKRAGVGQPFVSARLGAGVDFYFLAFFAFFFFTILSSFCSDMGKSEVSLEPTNGPNPCNSRSRDLFHTMVNRIEVVS
jgi:hypothetical protein